MCAVAAGASRLCNSCQQGIEGCSVTVLTLNVVTYSSKGLHQAQGGGGTRGGGGGGGLPPGWPHAAQSANPTKRNRQLSNTHTAHMSLVASFSPPDSPE
jgi:hypothetical protein